MELNKQLISSTSGFDEQENKIFLNKIHESFIAESLRTMETSLNNYSQINLQDVLFRIEFFRKSGIFAKVNKKSRLITDFITELFSLNNKNAKTNLYWILNEIITNSIKYSRHDNDTIIIDLYNQEDSNILVEISNVITGNSLKEFLHFMLNAIDYYKENKLDDLLVEQMLQNKSGGMGLISIMKYWYIMPKINILRLTNDCYRLYLQFEIDIDFIINTKK